VLGWKLAKLELQRKLPSQKSVPNRMCKIFINSFCASGSGKVIQTFLL
jgi:hypothetical protein